MKKNTPIVVCFLTLYMADILLLIGKTNINTSTDLYQKYFNLLSGYQQERYFSFCSQKDRQLYLMSRILLIEGAALLGITINLNEIKYNQFNKPYFENLLNFNISHSGEYAVCAVSSKFAVGVDIEEIKELDINLFSNVLTSNEYFLLVNSTNSLKDFYTIWTRKESALKANGTGLYLPMKEIDVLSDFVKIENEFWYFKTIFIENRYVCHLSLPQSDISISVLEFDCLDTNIMLSGTKKSEGGC